MSELAQTEAELVHLRSTYVLRGTYVYRSVWLDLIEVLHRTQEMLMRGFTTVRDTGQSQFVKRSVKTLN